MSIHTSECGTVETVMKTCLRRRLRSIELSVSGGGIGNVLLTVLSMIVIFGTASLPAAPGPLFNQQKEEAMSIGSFERKPALRYLSPHFPIYVFTEHTFKYGIAQPVPGVDLMRVIESRLEILSAELEFRSPTRNLLMDIFFEEFARRATLKGSNNYPSMLDIRDALHRKRFIALDRNKRSQESADNRLGGLFRSLPDVFGDVSVGFPIEVLDEINFSLELVNVAADVRRILYSWILNDLYMYREAAQLKGLRLAPKSLIFDEASDVFSRRLEEDGSTEHYFSELLTMGRERGLQVIALTQYGSKDDISHALLDNSQVKMILGGLGRADTYAEFGANLGATKAQIEYMLRHSSPGTGYAKDYRYGYPFRFEWPFIPFKDTVIHEYMIQRRLCEILPRLPVTPRVHPQWRSGRPFDWYPGQDDNRPPTATQAAPETARAETDTKKPDVEISTEALDLLQYWAEQQKTQLGRDGDPRLLLGMDKGFKHLKISSRRKWAALPKELGAAGLATLHYVRVGKGTRAVLEITERGWAFLCIPRVLLKGKGGWFHQYLARVISWVMDQRGYTCTVEGRLQDAAGMFKQVDVLCRHRATGEVLGIEIGLHSPEQEKRNALQDLTGPAPVDRLIVCSPTNKVLDPIRAAILGCDELHHVVGKIEFMCVGDLYV